MPIFCWGVAMRRRKRELEKMYEVDPSTKAFIIGVAIDRYSDIFNALDPAPFRRRDLDPDLSAFLEDCSAEIPLKYAVTLRFTAPITLRDPELEERIRVGLNTYFSFVMRSHGRERKQVYEQNVYYIFTSIFFLLSSFFLGSRISNNVFYLTLVEGLSIGGWVFLWEAISSFAFKTKSLNRKYKQYQRFYHCQIEFKYISKP